MKLFFSGTDSMGDELWQRVVPVCPWRLLSVHEDYLKNALNWLSYLPKSSNIEIMLDSGAFSAWTRGDVVTLEEVVEAYSTIIEKFESRMGKLWLLNLDVIPGNRGRVASQEEIAQCLVDSDKNFDQLWKRFGARMIPVYHQFEPVERLDFVLAQGSGYIGVSPRNDFPEPKRLKFARNVHYAVNGRGRTHGLGATGFRMMSTVPWHSVDSISWCYTAGLGAVQWFENGKLHKVDMSERDTEGSMGAYHFTVINPSVRESLRLKAEQYEFTTDQLRDDHRVRKAFNMLALVELADALKQQELPDQPDMFAGELTTEKHRAEEALADAACEGSE